MRYCTVCGEKLISKYLKREGDIPYCTSCKEFRFPLYNTAVSMVCLNPDLNKILLIQQYGKPSYILVAGYVNRGECVEEAVVREVKEEIGVDVRDCFYLKSEYFEKSNTLMLSYAAILEEENLSTVDYDEVDLATWFSFQEAKEKIRPDSLAERFLSNFLLHYQKSIPGDKI